MINLANFVFESKEISTKSNKERKEELERWLKHKKYEDYVDTLNKMLEDPKAKALLEDGFGGKLGDTKLIFSINTFNEAGKLISQTGAETIILSASFILFT